MDLVVISSAAVRGSRKNKKKCLVISDASMQSAFCRSASFSGVGGWKRLCPSLRARTFSSTYKRAEMRAHGASLKGRRNPETKPFELFRRSAASSFDRPSALGPPILEDDCHLRHSPRPANPLLDLPDHRILFFSSTNSAFFICAGPSPPSCWLVDWFASVSGLIPGRRF